MNMSRMSLMSDRVKPRRYRSATREEGARRSRRRMVEAATRLFLMDGYAGTPIRRVAEEASVSEELVFHVFGTKRGLLQAVVDVAVGGDDEPVRFLEREEPQRMRRETDQRVQVRMLAAGIAEQMARVRPVDDMLRAAVALDPGLAALREEVQVAQRRRAMETVAGWVAARGPLAEGVTVTGAGLTLWALAGPEVHRMLVDQQGLSTQEYVDWLSATLVRALLPPA